MIKPIVAFGDPLLKAEAEEIEKDFPGLEKLLDDMWETMYEAEGVGLAAPQIGESIRLFIVDGSPFGEGEDADPDCVGFKRVMINPVIYESSKKTSVMEEGCLSIPGIREEVVRPVSVKIEYFNENWDLKEEMLSGVAARIVQHEYDHLDGIMIPDHISSIKRRLLHGKLRDIGLGKVAVGYRMRLPKGKVR
ncbi:MAG: peptide deformylase [Crocinitomicaceae bacterium]|nr:peptide deformylase [Crocinitomicaceae bacterium]|tara:strand:- start:804 stop:1379 length:576 start_codon:yes stop_codon:yes gene_type:complete